MTVCYFTGTGNSLYVANRIGGKLLSIPKLMREERVDISDEAVGVVCPVYCGEMPKKVNEFFAKASIKADYFFFVCTYGMADSVAKQNAVTAAQKAGLTVSYVNTIRMVDNFLPGFEMQNQMETAAGKGIEEHLDQICSDIAARKINPVTVGAGDKLKMNMLHQAMGKSVLKGIAAQSYIVNSDCILCGICAKVCPANNITVTDKVDFSDHCEVCYACLHNCPKNAIHLKNERSSARFRNEHITLGEIIAANG